MSEPTRYDLVENEMESCTYGYYVTYDEYNDLETEKDKLQEILDKIEGLLS